MKVDTYSFGKVVIEGRTFTRDVIVFPDRVVEDWWRKSGHSLCAGDLSEILEYSPDVLIIGKGAMGLMKVPKETAVYLADNGIELIARKSKEACKLFNDMQGRRVALGLHLTC